MRLLLGFVFVFWGMNVVSAKDRVYKTPLSKYSKEWDNPKYRKCNSAAKVGYMTKDEKEIIWILNMARVNPQLFRRTILPLVATLTTSDTGSVKYYKSLDSTIRVMKPLGILLPDSLCARSARTHAEGSAASKKIIGHSRLTPESSKATHFAGECCYDGSTDPLTIVLVLLVDDYIESLGHRRICLGSFTKLGTGLAPIEYSRAYKDPRAAAVIDFYY